MKPTTIIGPDDTGSDRFPTYPNNNQQQTILNTEDEGADVVQSSDASFVSTHPLDHKIAPVSKSHLMQSINFDCGVGEFEDESVFKRQASFIPLSRGKASYR